MLFRVLISLSCLYTTTDAFISTQPSHALHPLQKVSTLSHPIHQHHRHSVSTPTFHETIKGIRQARSSATKLSLLPELSLLPDFFSSISLSLSEPQTSDFQTAINAIETSTLSILGHDILTFLFVTVLVIPISNSFGTNPTLLFLLVGCVLGPYNLEIFSNNEADLQLGDFGILFLLFNEGLGLSPDRIKDLKAFSNLGLLQIMSSMALFFFGTLIGGPFILSFLDKFMDVGLLRPILSSPVQAFCIASAGALSSSAFVLPVLKSKGWEDRKEGIAGLSILLLQDLAVAPLLVLLPVLAGSGPQTPSEFGALILKAVFGFGGVLVLGRYLLRYVFDIVASAKSTETFVAAALLVAIGMGQTADMLGLSASTGAFAAGVLLAGNKFRPQIQADIKPFEGILLGIFFITAGAELDPAVVIHEWPTLILGITGFLIIKTAVLFASGPAIGLSKAEAARVALTLSGGGEFSFVLFKLAQELGVLPEDLNKLLTASVIISMSLTPVLGDLGSKLGDYLEELEPPTKVNPWDGLSVKEAEALFDETDQDGNGSIDLDELRTTLVKLNIPFETIANIFVAFDTNGDEEISVEEWNTGIKEGLLETALRYAPEPNQNTEIAFEEDATVICGFGKMGRAVYSMLQEMGEEQGGIVAFTLDPSRVTAGVVSGAPVVFGDGGRYELYKAAGCKSPKAVLITYGSRARRMNVLIRIRQALPDTKIYCRADDQGEYTDLLAAGADEVISESTEAVVRFGSLLNICTNIERTEELREMLLQGTDTEGEPLPGYSEDDINDIVDRTGMDLADITKLYSIFESLGGDKDTDVSVKVLEEFLARNSDNEPLDIGALDTYLKLVDEDGEGDLSFDEFVRVSCLRSV